MGQAPETQRGDDLPSAEPSPNQGMSPGPGLATSVGGAGEFALDLGRPQAHTDLLGQPPCSFWAPAALTSAHHCSADSRSPESPHFIRSTRTPWDFTL